MLILFFFVLCVTIFLAIPIAFNGAPFLPTDRTKVRAIVSLARVKPGERAVDLGPGDGRLVVALARAGACATGYEINPLLVLWSRFLIWRAGVGQQTQVYTKNFWHENLSSNDVVVLFGVGTSMMPRLERKLQSELRPGARVVSNGFVFPTWPITERHGALYLYRKEL